MRSGRVTRLPTPSPCPFCGIVPDVLTEADGVIGAPILRHNGRNVMGGRQGENCPLGYWTGFPETWERRA